MAEICINSQSRLFSFTLRNPAEQRRWRSEGSKFSLDFAQARNSFKLLLSMIF